MEKSENNLFYKNISEFRKELNKIIKDLKENDLKKIVITRNKENAAVVLSIDEYNSLVATATRSREFWENPEKLLSHKRTYERTRRGDSTGTMSLGDGDWSLRSGVFIEAEQLIYEDLKDYDWFEGVVWNAEGFVVFVSSLEATGECVPKNIKVREFIFGIEIRVSDGEPLDDRSFIPQRRERLKYLRRQEKEDLEAARKNIYEYLKEFEGFFTVESKDGVFIVSVCDVDEAKKYVPDCVNVPNNENPRNGFLIKIKKEYY